MKSLHSLYAISKDEIRHRIRNRFLSFRTLINVDGKRTPELGYSVVHCGRESVATGRESSHLREGSYVEASKESWFG